MRARDLLVELLREHVNTELELARVRPEGDLGKDLVGKRAGHNEGWVASGATKVDETSFSEENDVAPVGQSVTIHLRLDVDDLYGVLL